MKEHLPRIKCECGAEILLIPNLEVMDKAIEAHVTEHTKKETDKNEKEIVAERIREGLITQVLEHASQIR